MGECRAYGRVGVLFFWGSGKGWLGGARARGGSKGFGSGGGVGGRGTGPRDGANFATCVVFLSFLMGTKRRKMAFLACLAVPQEGARARGGIQGLRFRKGRCVIFRKLEG